MYINLKLVIAVVFILCPLVMMANNHENKNVVADPNTKTENQKQAPQNAAEEEKAKTGRSPRIYKLIPKDELKADVEVSFPANI